MAMAFKQKRPIRGMEAVAERPDGTRIPFVAYPTPLFDASGNLTGAVNMLLDISERKRAEEAHAARDASRVRGARPGSDCDVRSRHALPSCVAAIHYGLPTSPSHTAHWPIALRD